MIISLEQLVVLLLILGRIAGVFIQAPIFSSRSFPVFAKSALAVWIALLLWFVTPINATLPQTPGAFVFSLVIEVGIGFVIGFICNLIFLMVQSGGEIADLQMGLSVATTLDPIFGAVISIIGRLAFFLALVIFIIADGHHLLLSALHQSFTAFPVGSMVNFSSPELAVQMINLGTMFWATAIKLAAPIVLLIFLADFSFGIVSRVAPQVNVFMLGFQVKPAIGLIGIMLTLPFIVKYVNYLIEFMAGQFILLAQTLK